MSPTTMLFAGQTRAQVPHRMQSSLTVYSRAASLLRVLAACVSCHVFIWAIFAVVTATFATLG